MGALLGLLGVIGCAHFAENRSSNRDLTVVSFGSLMGEIDECG